jgi:hypothetical protein
LRFVEKVKLRFLVSSFMCDGNVSIRAFSKTILKGEENVVNISKRPMR